ncbi:MAG: HAD hydrolase-like protein [Patescibacteria group bacterium]
MSKFKTIVFDWDGTIVDSNELKRLAWLEVFPSHTKPYFLIQNRAPNLSISTRSQILRNIFAKSGISDLTEEAFVAKYSKVYADIVERGILQNGFLPGAKEALENLYTKIPLYVNSATPEAPLLNIVEKIGAVKYFKKVYGRSEAQENHTQHDLKVENLQDISFLENISTKEMLMVGDSEADRKSAEIFGCEFSHVSDFFKKPN